MSLALADFVRSHDGMEELWKEAKPPKKLACVLSGTDPKRISSKTELLAGLTSKLTMGCEDSVRTAAAEVFAELPQATKQKAAASIDLLEQHPRFTP